MLPGIPPGYHPPPGLLWVDRLNPQPKAITNISANGSAKAERGAAFACPHLDSYTFNES
jgi:hypothetical protein